MSPLDRILGVPTGRRRADGEVEGFGGPPAPRPIRILATFALTIVALATVAVLAYSAIVQHDQASVALLGTLGTASIAALVVLSGGKHDREE